MTAVVIGLVLLVSTGASASWLSCAMSDQLMPNGTRCACVHEHDESAVPALSRLPCCTSVEIARAELPPSSVSLHLALPAPVLLEIAEVTRAPLALVSADVRVRPNDAGVRATGPPIPIRLRHLLI
jgi:hypothetical protein